MEHLRHIQIVQQHIGDAEHKDMDEYLFCKSLLFQKCNFGIINCDDPAWEKVIENKTCQIMTYGYSDNADLKALDDSLISKSGFIGVNFNSIISVAFTLTYSHKIKSCFITIERKACFSRFKL